MATPVKGGGAGKEKRGTSSPSNSIIKKSPKPLTSSPTSSSSSTKKEKTTSSTDTCKPVPNYLKPTISSNLDFSRLPKRISTESSAQKPGLDRRRSFDRPPPSSQLHKAIRGASGLRDVKSFRSPSFSTKTTPSTRPSLCSKKDVKVEEPNLAKSRSLKKSTLSSASNATSPTSMNKFHKSVGSESSIDNESGSRSVDHLDIEDDLVNIDNEVQSLPEISEMPDSNEELGDPTSFEEEEEKLTVEEDDKDATGAEEDESTAADKVEDEPAAQESETPKQTIESVEQKQIQIQTEDDAGENVVADQEGGATETSAEEEKEDETSKNEEENVWEETDAKVEIEDVSSPAAASDSFNAESAGKKDNQDYNDVIEETASKLRSKKNKVLALAGAFETVISLQDTNKS